ncbi:hypothetical protein [Pelotalea chapellei]|uniref:Uncharacterized protein n=1 Tax=Pelotalea chapellei TaxID=44671 RepID=A0ABS5U5E2_9BACT|nr:hypothetical protein [Pelotalea chapellei]MBT1070879.1 hypothetical protein [Pelotalea chapellei]
MTTTIFGSAGGNKPQHVCGVNQLFLARPNPLKAQEKLSDKSCSGPGYVVIWRHNDLQY